MGARIIKNNQEYKQTDADYEIYSDFDTMFRVNPFNGQLARKTNESSVAQSLRNLLLTNKYERRRNPNFGSWIRNYLFENFTIHTAGEVEDQVRAAIRSHEPRAKIISLEVTATEDENELVIDLRFATVSSPTPERLRVSLYRVR